MATEDGDRWRNDPIGWTKEIEAEAGVEPFIVSARLSSFRNETGADGLLGDEPGEQEAALQSVDENFAMVEAEIILHYRIKTDPNQGLLKFIRFSTDERQRRQRMNQRQRSLKEIALREVTQYLTAQDLDSIIASDRSQMTLDLERRIQAAFDQYETGVEILNVSNSWIRPAGEAAPRFEVLGFELADREQARVDAERDHLNQLVRAAGSPAIANAIIAEIDVLKRLRKEGASDEERAAQTDRIDELLMTAGGEAAKRIAEARTDQWNKILGASARVEEFLGRIEAYNAGPGLYREFLMMDVLTRILANAEKYIIAVDPSKVNITIDVLQDDDSMVFAEALQTGETVEEGVGQQ